MTLVEVLVGLAILALVLGVALTSLGPWFEQSRRTDRDAEMWASVASAQLSLSDLTTGAIDPGQNLHFDRDQARFRAIAPRLGPDPIDLTVRIVDTSGEHRLVVDAPAIGVRGAVLLTSEARLRLRPRFEGRGEPRLLIEREQRGAWLPLIVAPFAANAPLSCPYDFVSQACRP